MDGFAINGAKLTDKAIHLISQIPILITWIQENKKRLP